VLQRVRSLRRLAEMGAVSANDLLDNERSLQQVEARMSDLTHEIPRTESALAELARKSAEAALRFASEADKEASDVALQQAKLKESALALQDRSVRSDVVAPISGIVNKLYVSTVGGVVKSGEPLAVIVPTDSAIAVEARLSPSDRAEVWPGLPAIVKISAYDFSVYGGLKGAVVEVSPDALQDERGQPYFRIRLEASAASFGPDRPVVPGMVADVDILSGRHTILETLLRPLRYVRDNALRR
jgi:HlyD family type I secretion membrane fusion protein